MELCSWVLSSGLVRLLSSQLWRINLRDSRSNLATSSLCWLSNLRQILGPCDIVIPPISTAKIPKTMAVIVSVVMVVMVVSSTMVCGYA